MDFNNDNSDKKKKIVTLVAVLLILCIVIAVIIFLILNNDLWNNNDTPSNTPSSTYSDNSLVSTDSSESLPTNTTRIPKEINIRYENDVLIFDGLSKECEFTTLFDSSKDYIFSEYRNQAIPSLHLGMR